MSKIAQIIKFAKSYESRKLSEKNLEIPKASFNPFQVAEVASLGQKQWETICSETCPGNHDDDDEYCMVVIMNVMIQFSHQFMNKNFASVQ